jgi:hypothetical protein
MAGGGLIPGASRTAGGHWRVKNDAVLAGWIARIAMNQVQRSAVSRSKIDPLRMTASQLENRLESILISGEPIPPDLVKSLA